MEDLKEETIFVERKSMFLQIIRVLKDALKKTSQKFAYSSI